MDSSFENEFILTAENLNTSGHSESGTGLGENREYGQLKAHSDSGSDSDSDSDSNSDSELSSKYGLNFDSKNVPKCEDNLDIITRDLSYLFSNNKYYEILTLIPSLHEYPILPTSVRIIIALTLFALGRVGGALREVAIAIETEYDPNEKERYIQCLVGFFKQLGMNDRAVTCFGEIIVMAKTDMLINKDNEEKVRAINRRIEIYQSDLKDCLKNHRAKKDALRASENMPLHEQAERYLASSGNLDCYSLGRICITAKNLIDESIELLTGWDSNSGITLPKDPLQLIFGAIKYLGPLYLYNDLKENQVLLKDYLNNEIAKYPIIDYSIELKVFIKSLDRWDNYNRGTTLSLYGLITRHKVIIGFLHFLNKEYDVAIKNFEWVLSFLKKIFKIFKSFAGRNASLSNVTKSVITVLLCQCYDFGNVHCSNQKLDDLFVTLLEATKIRSKSEYSCGRLATYFIAFGLIYEKVSINQALKITIENGENDTISTALRLDPTNLEEMIRKYILATANKPPDDPSAIILYDRIIWGILLCGGIHLKTLWFFILLKNHFFIEFDFGPLHLFPNHEYKLFAKDNIISQYDNGWELIDKIYNLWNTLTNDEKSNIWDPSNGNMFLIPQIFDNGNKLVLVDSYYDENLRNSSRNFVFASEFQIKHKLKGHIKLQSKIISNRIDLSKELISLWCTTFEECHGSIPEVLSDFFMDL